MHELEGLRAELADGSVVGTVREVVHGPGGELLVLARPEAPDALVPFVRAIVPTVDLAAGRLIAHAARRPPRPRALTRCSVAACQPG